MSASDIDEYSFNYIMLDFILCCRSMICIDFCIGKFNFKVLCFSLELIVKCHLVLKVLKC